MSDDDRTIIRPQPGRRRTEGGQSAPFQGFGEAPPRSPVQASGEATVDLGEDVDLGSGGPVAHAATPLLMSGARVHRLTSPPDIERLRVTLSEGIRRFETRIRALGLPNDLVLHARYVVCATLDDMILNTPWGGTSLWARRGMVSTFHRETVGGERFFDNLAMLKNDPGRNAGVLELMYVCLSLGFQGHMRITPRGGAEIARLREDLHRLLRGGDPEEALSVHWRAPRAPASGLSSIVPSWVIASGAAVLAVLAYVIFSFAVNGLSDGVLGRFAGYPPRGAVVISRPPPPPPPPVPQPKAPAISKFLEKEIAEGLVTVTETFDSVSVHIRNRGLFASGSATLEKPFLPTMERIAQALETEKGAVLVVGHTDNQPIRSVRFPSNWHLSVARAESVGSMVAAKLSDKSRLKTVGKGDTEPVADNATAEGREANRRIDVVLNKEGGR